MRVKDNLSKNRVCLLAFSALLGLGTAGPATVVPAAAQEAEARAFAITQQPLSSALLEFAEQTELDF